MLKSTLNTSLRVLFGLVFILSGLSKLFPIETFEYDLVDYGIITWSLSAYLARLIISAEIALGILLIVNWKPRKVSFPAVLIMLILFTVFLLIRIYTKGNEENCGCFGSWIPLSNYQSLLKNCILLLFGIYLWYQGKSGKNPKLLNLVAIFTVCSTLLLVFILRLPEDFYLKEVKTPLANNRIAPEVFPYIYTSSNDSVRPGPNKELVVLFSLTCDHCIMAARKLSIIKKSHPEINTLIYLNGHKEDLESFLKKSQLNLPYAIFNKRAFIQIAQGSFPKIYLIKNYEIKEYWGGDGFTENELIRSWNKF